MLKASLLIDGDYLLSAFNPLDLTTPPETTPFDEISKYFGVENRVVSKIAYFTAGVISPSLYAEVSLSLKRSGVQCIALSRGSMTEGRPVDAGICTRAMVQALKAPDGPSRAGAFIFFARSGFLEQALSVLRDEGRLIHFALFEGDTLDVELSPFESPSRDRSGICQVKRGRPPIEIVAPPSSAAGTKHPIWGPPGFPAATSTLPPPIAALPDPFGVSAAELPTAVADDIPQDVKPTPARPILSLDLANSTETKNKHVQQPASGPPVKTTLPPGFRMEWDPRYQRYYYVQRDAAGAEKSTWEHPSGAASQADVDRQLHEMLTTTSEDRARTVDRQSFEPSRDAPRSETTQLLSTPLPPKQQYASLQIDSPEQLPKTTGSATPQTQVTQIPKSEPTRIAVRPAPAPMPNSSFPSAQPAADEPPLPPGWERMVDATSGKTYYVDHNTKRTSWTRPPTN